MNPVRRVKSRRIGNPPGRRAGGGLGERGGDPGHFFSHAAAVIFMGFGA
jgi:hypothetical protein